jgi:hypothetical protein
MFQGSVRVLATHSIRQFPLNSPPVHHHVPSGFKHTLSQQQLNPYHPAFNQSHFNIS